MLEKFEKLAESFFLHVYEVIWKNREQWIYRRAWMSLAASRPKILLELLKGTQLKHSSFILPGFKILA